MSDSVRICLCMCVWGVWGRGLRQNMLNLKWGNWKSVMVAARLRVGRVTDIKVDFETVSD